MTTPADILPAVADRRFMDKGMCRGLDPDMFFPERGGPTREAKVVCQACAVRDECLEYALDNAEKFGIWGGTSERERRQLRRTRATRRQSAA
jgi:WhiB family redox-sensing transcriptional regulator